MSLQKPVRSKLEFIKQMRKLKESTLAVNFQANPEIINHKKKREIYALLEDTRQELLKSGRDPAEVEEVIKDAEAKMLEKFAKGELEISIDKQKMMDSHQLEALKIGSNYKFGTAFDFELQEKLRLEKVYKRELERLEQMQMEEEEAEMRINEGSVKHKSEPIDDQELPTIQKSTPIVINEPPVSKEKAESRSPSDTKEKLNRRQKDKKKRHRDSSSNRSSSSDHVKKSKKSRHEKITKKSKKHDRHSRRRHSSSDSSSDHSESKKKKRPSRFN